MRQALHIFKKDIRHLWFEIAVTLTISGAFAFVGARRAFWLDDPNANRSVAWVMITLLLPVAWWALIARVVHSEAIPGDRQFWITRPYAWKSLLLAKALFIVSFVNVPMLIADAIIIRAFGFAIGRQIPGLLWTQVLLSAAFLLPVAALSSITTGLIELLSISLFLLVAVLAWNVAAPARPVGATWGPLDWIAVYDAILIVLIAALAILIWQYARRKTWASRTIAIATALLVILGSPLIPWTSAFAIQSHLSKQRSSEALLRVAFDSNRKWLARALIERDGRVERELPLQITGIPAGMDVRAEGLTAAIESPAGAVWQTGRRPWTYANQEESILSLQTDVDPTFYKDVRNEPVNIRGTLYFTLYGNEQITHIPFQSRSVPVPSMGICSASRGAGGRTYFLLCSSAFRAEPDLVSIRFVELGKNSLRVTTPYGPLRWISYSPFPADLNINPVSQYFTYRKSEQPLSDVVIESVEPLLHMQRNFEIDGLRLSDFEVRLTPPLQ